MATTLKIGLVNVPLMLVPIVNSRYSTNGLHRYSPCCKAKARNRMYCESCGETILYGDVLKGLDEKTILTKEQHEQLKECLDTNTIEVLGIKKIGKTLYYDILPYIQKSYFILPSISKGYQKSNIRVFYSFIGAVKELNRCLICKFISRGLEHLGVLMFYKEDLLFVEIPFKSYYNMPEIIRMKEAVNNLIELDRIDNLEQFKEQAVEFIKTYKNKKTQLSEVDEEKAELLKQFIKEIREGKIKTIKPKKRKKEVNPFV